MPRFHIVRMAGNIGVDFLLGAIPWVGAIPDFFFRSNSRNLKIVKRWLDKHHPATMIVEGEDVARDEADSRNSFVIPAQPKTGAAQSGDPEGS